MKKFWITFGFYAKDHFTKKSLIILALFLIAPLGIFFAIDTFGGGSYDEVAVVQASSEFVIPTELFTGIERVNIHFLGYDEARTKFDAGTVSDVFVISGTERPELEIWSDSLTGHSTVQWIIENHLSNIHLEAMMVEHELPEEVVAQLIMPIHVDMEVADIEDLIAVEIINFVLPYAVFMLVLMSGQMVANGVASEKTSRVMEVMLGKVHPTYTMTSKVLSSLIGVLLPILALIGGLVLSHVFGFVELGMLVELVNEYIPITGLILTGVVLILGFFCFIFLFAAAGAVANSIESLQSTLAPITYLIIVPFAMASFMGIDNAVMDILVYVPFFSPFVLVQRYLIGASGMIEIGIVIVLMILFSFFTLWLSARLYMNGISNTKEKLKLADFKQMLTK